MSKDHYDALLPEIEAVADAETKTPNMPVDTFVQEATNLEVWSSEDKEKLMSAGVAETVLDSLSPLTSALRYSQSLWTKERYSKEEARQEWDTRAPEAEALKDELEHTFRFAFRKRPDLLNKVQAIEAGHGHADMIQDLSDLSVLGTANLPLLEAVGFDTAKLKTAETMASEMSVLLATMNGERFDNNQTKKLRDKAYTLLKASVDEIREAGKFVFWKDENRKRGYFSAHWRSN